MKPIHLKNRTIGLLGGSFNPAHEGHLHISLYALKKLHFDQVWWLVSPQNPLKNKDSLADYKLRFESARGYARHPRIHVSDVELRQNLRYTYKTLRFLKRHHPGVRFLWMMGADNLVQFHRWNEWQKIVHLVPVVVFDRAPYSNRALHSHGYHYMRQFLLKNTGIEPVSGLPAFWYHHMKLAPASSTDIRKRLGKRAFLGHTKGVGCC